MIPDMFEIASVLGAHGFRSAPPIRRLRMRKLVDAVTGEPIAIVTAAEARELAAWLERERPLEPRPIPYRLSSRKTIRWRAIPLMFDEPVDRAEIAGGMFGRPGKAPRCCDRAPFHAGPCAPPRAKSNVDKPTDDPYTDEET